MRSIPFLHSCRLKEEEGSALKELVASCDGEPYSDFESFFLRILELRENVPHRLAKVLKGLSVHRGCLLLRGLPINVSLPPTPLTPFAKNPLPNLRTEPLLALLSSFVGEPFSFREWDAGYIVHNKYPIRSHREVQFGSNAVEFLIHTETPFREFSPDYIALLCLRSDPNHGAITRLCSLEDAVNDLTPDEIEILRGPFYAFVTDNPVIFARGKSLTAPMPILSTRDGAVIYEYVHDLVAVTEDSHAVVEKLKAAVVRHMAEIELVSGDLIIIDNSHIVHGRSAYSPQYDGHDRWLQRMLLTTRLFNGDGMPDSRLVEDRRLTNYPTEYRDVLRGLELQS